MLGVFSSRTLLAVKILDDAMKSIASESIIPDVKSVCAAASVA